MKYHFNNATYFLHYRNKAKPLSYFATCSAKNASCSPIADFQ